jgi:uncharacterized YccA/Bax inhibitor family protein
VKFLLLALGGLVVVVVECHLRGQSLPSSVLAYLFGLFLGVVAEPRR